jgi:hypothetical protein
MSIAPVAAHTRAPSSLLCDCGFNCSVALLGSGRHPELRTLELGLFADVHDRLAGLELMQ